MRLQLERPPLPPFPQNIPPRQPPTGPVPEPEHIERVDLGRRCPSCNRPVAAYWSLLTTVYRNHRRRGESVPRPRRSLEEFCFRCLGRKLKDTAVRATRRLKNSEDDDEGQAA